ncbi:SDR family oxidoreductase [Rhizobium sp. 57MFTsu3.2]|uniref:SDR family NAD(P)-dependent oxidoreductase n=1 Tax=Rhizobium sp. 57MFTsu3.2 TaxID=1048681 RepID=UPI00146CC7C0|nr:SDR family oxidoreductase [Rhizobium sp. 57MFTsu3.2]NMN71510.1 NAD(P)-dependent dehydrogenase (short-subunit alcohol dehydrogenase family) [Rhizobium sp. 57MFTsu3.2]
MTKPLALITGGGTGIGRATAERLLSEGWRVLAVGLDHDEDLPKEIAFHKANVADTDAVVAALAGEDALHGLVHCAGILRHEREWQKEDFEAVMNINVTAGFALATTLLPKLEKAGGGVVMLASMWSIFGSAGAPAYTASKGAVAAVTRSMAVAWAPRGVRANSVAPGWVETRMSERARTNSERSEKIGSRIPMGRWAQPSEIASVIHFLLSVDAAYVTGVMLPIDGGYSVC